MPKERSPARLPRAANLKVQEVRRQHRFDILRVDGVDNIRSQLAKTKRVACFHKSFLRQLQVSTSGQRREAVCDGVKAEKAVELL